MVNKLEFCSSYTEASMYRSNTATTQSDDMTGAITDIVVQFHADNVGHANRTLDGHGSIHAMCQMATFTPDINVTRT